MYNSTVGVLVDSRKKVSLSILQILLWTIIILGAIVATAMHNLRFGTGEGIIPKIPPQLFVLLGISSMSYIGSPMIKHLKKREHENTKKAKQKLKELKAEKRLTTEPINEGTIVMNRQIKDASFFNIFEGEEIDNSAVPDIGKVQMFLFTVIAVAIYSVILARALHSEAALVTLPAVNDSLLYLIAISHSGYLIHKTVPHSR